jgi:hypothetical protein
LLHHDDRQAALGGVGQTGSTGLVFRVQKVVLDLAEVPVVAVDHRGEIRRLVMVGESDVADPPIGLDLLEKLEDAEPFELLPRLRTHAMHEIAVDMVGTQPLKLAVEDGVHVLPGFHIPVRELGREQHLVPIAIGQDIADEALTLTRSPVPADSVVGERRVHVVDPAVQGVVDHVPGEGPVDLVVAAVKHWEPHGSETQHRDFFPRTAEGAI